jgi:hypothetical protein
MVEQIAAARQILARLDFEVKLARRRRRTLQAQQSRRQQSHRRASRMASWDMATGDGELRHCRWFLA